MDTTATAPRNPYEFTREAYNDLIKNMPKENISKRSQYEEIELIEDCTLYDIYRQPRPPVTDPSVTKTLHVRVLNDDLKCPICLGIIHQTMVVMECLHRFCGECIQKCLRLGIKECPKCRIHIPSKRSLRRDENFDDLIHKIYPNLEEFEQNEAKLIEESNRARHFNNAWTESTKMGVQNQANMRRQAKKKGPSPGSSAPATPMNNTETQASQASTASASASTDANGTEEEEQARKKQRTVDTNDENTSNNEQDRVNLRVLLHPDEVTSVHKLERTLFRTSHKLKIRHLKKHLSSLLKLESYANMRIVLPANNCSRSGLSSTADATSGGAAVRKDLLFDQELEDFLTLYDIYQQYDMGTKWELQLYYHFSDTIVNGMAQFIPLRVNGTSTATTTTSSSS